MLDNITSTLKTGNSLINASVLPSTIGADISQSPKQAVKQEAPPRETNDQEAHPSKELLESLEKDLNLLHNVGLQFSVHDTTGRTMIKVVDKETEKLIREIPPEGVLNLAAKMEEMLGILFDQKV